MPKREVIASFTGLVGSTEQGRSARPGEKRKAREEDDGNERRALKITPGRKELRRWNERGRAIELWCKGLGTTKETKQDGGHYTGPSERLSSER